MITCDTLLVPYPSYSQYCLPKLYPRWMESYQWVTSIGNDNMWYPICTIPIQFIVYPNHTLDEWNHTHGSLLLVMITCDTLFVLYPSNSQYTQTIPNHTLDEWNHTHGSLLLVIITCDTLLVPYPSYSQYCIPKLYPSWMESYPWVSSIDNDNIWYLYPNPGASIPLHNSSKGIPLKGMHRYLHSNRHSGYASWHWPEPVVNLRFSPAGPCNSDSQQTFGYVAWCWCNKPLMSLLLSLGRVNSHSERKQT